MQHKTVTDSALSVALARKSNCDFAISDDFVREAEQRPRKQQVEQKASASVKPRLSAIERANKKEREEISGRRDSIVDAERRWSEVFG